MGELKNTVALLVAALAQFTHTACSFEPRYFNLRYHGQERFEYGAFSKLVVGVAIRSQTSAPLGMPIGL